MANQLSYNPEVEENVLLETDANLGWSVILYNDDFNTFEWVIDCLIKYCGHDNIQAEQCAWIVHTKGKCTVKNGEFFDLQPICVALCDSGLSASLEQ